MNDDKIYRQLTMSEIKETYVACDVGFRSNADLSAAAIIAAALIKRTFEVNGIRLQLPGVTIQ